MTLYKSSFLILTLFCILALSFKDYTDKPLRTDGYFYTYDTLVNEQTKENIVRFYPVVLFADGTLSDFYYFKSQTEFEDFLATKSLKWLKKYSKSCNYKITSDSIFIHGKTWANKWFNNGTSKIVDFSMKGIILNDTSYRITENIFLHNTIKTSSDFKFVHYLFNR